MKAPAKREDFWVYKVREKSGALIYVGITGTPAARLGSHSRDSAWARFAHTIDVEHYKTRRGARARELRLIREHRPRFNIESNPDARLPDEGWLTAEQAGERMRVSAGTIIKHIKLGNVGGTRTPYGWRLAETDLDAWFEAGVSQPRMTP